MLFYKSYCYKNILSDYVEKCSDLGSFFLKRKKTNTKIENKGFQNLIQVFSKKNILKKYFNKSKTSLDNQNAVRSLAKKLDVPIFHIV